MNKKQVTFLWIIAAALGVAVAIVKSAQNRGETAVTELSRGDRLLADFPAGEVAAVTLKGADGTVHLKKTGSGWVVAERDDFPADFQLLAGTLRTLAEVEVTQGLEAGPAYDPRFGMDREASEPDDHGIHLVFADEGGRELESVALGKETQSGADVNPMMMMQSAGGRFVRLGSEPEAVYVIAETFPRVTADPKDWLRDEFVKVEKIKSITLRAPENPEFEPWTLARTAEIADFGVEGIGPGEEINATTANPLKNFFSFARFEDVVPAAEAAAQSDPREAREATITTFDGFTYTLGVVPKKTPETSEPNAPTPPQNYFLTLKVAADLAAERVKPAEESEEEAETRDKEFAERKKDLGEKLEREQGFQGRTFEVTQWTVNALMKERSDLVKAKAAAPDTGGAIPGIPGGAIPGIPGGAIPGIPGGAIPGIPGGPLRAVSPPVQVPTQPDPEQPDTEQPDTEQPDTEQPDPEEPDPAP